MRFGSYASRRFVMALIACATATALQCFGKLDAHGNSYAQIIIWTVGAYIAGATVESVKTPRPTSQRPIEGIN